MNSPLMCLSPVSGRLRSIASLFLAVLFSAGIVTAQNPRTIIQRYLDDHNPEKSLSRSDFSEWTITDQHTSRQSGVLHVYIQQELGGIPVSNGIANFSIKDETVMHMGNRLVSGLSEKAQYRSPALNPEDAIEAATVHLNLPSPKDIHIIQAISSRHFIFSGGSVSQEQIPVRLMYYAVSEKDVRLVWDLSIHTFDAQHWWSLRIDAHTGEVLFQNDWVLHCNFDHSPFSKCHHEPIRVNKSLPESLEETHTASGQYAVYALPVESPNHGARSALFDPADMTASPYGWHDINGIVGPEYTITRGNNVHAYEDGDDDNQPGYSPDGTEALNFIFPLNHADHPESYLDAAITNLFYMNNMMHDVWYHYGFDEPSGNFQQNNYGLGGFEEDYVRAEAQDGGGRNNANFSTPPDGSRPRMQMYLWDTENEVNNYMDILSPAGIAGPYMATSASFGPALPLLSLMGQVVLIEDHIAPSEDGCDSILNAEQLVGKIVMIDRGNCIFTKKAQAAQDAGAIGIIFVSTFDGPPTPVGGSSSAITIPSVMISKADGQSIKAILATEPVTASLHNSGTFDSGLDNGIIAHEYGHGISNRLTGGGTNTDCLSNAEQMGEGWSDWFGLILTIEPGDKGTDVRGIGTYTKGQSITGEGLRPAPYSTDFEVNSFTYGATNNVNGISQPHGVGFIFATALWDLTWALIDAYGGEPDPDIYSGAGGNNIAMRLIMEAMKLQPCRPGMIDGRDAILLADLLLYDGLHQCLIWEVFTRRGFGESAKQGSTDSRTDQVEAFDLPSICQTALEPPLAQFSFGSLSSCTTTIVFTDESTLVPQSWFWDFGDGHTSTLRHPTHTYLDNGPYSVKLVVTNTLGADSAIVEINTFILPSSPVAFDVDVCEGDTAFVMTSVSGTAVWRDENGTVVNTGDTLVVAGVDSVHTYFVENQQFSGTGFVGPVNNSIGNGGYHGTGYFGAVNFTAYRGFELVSTWVNARGAGPRTFTLARGTNFDGSVPHDSMIVGQVTVDLMDGPQRILLDLTIPDAGAYYLGGSFSEAEALYRNNSGANYPYSIPGYLTLTASSAGPDAMQFYYYVYDLEIRDEPCISDRVMVKVSPVTSQFSYIDQGFTVVFLDESVGAYSWFWDFGDGQTSLDQNPVHVYDMDGEYEVALTINNGACSYSEPLSLLTNTQQDRHHALDLTLRPNPARGFTSLLLPEPVNEDLKVDIRDFSGKILKSYTWTAGLAEFQLQVSDWPSAMYIVQITGTSYQEIRKLIVD